MCTRHVDRVRGGERDVFRQGRETEVQNLDLTLVGHHDVAGLQIPVDDARRVRGGERIRDLDGVTQRVGQPQPLLRNQRVHRAPLDQLHRQVVGAIGRPDVEDGDDVRVMELGGELRFLHEPAAALGVRDELRRQHFQRHLPIEPLVPGLIDLAHAPGAEKRAHFVGAKTSAGRERHLG